MFYRHHVGDRLGQCTCYGPWHSIVPPPLCPVHGAYQWHISYPMPPVSITLTTNTPEPEDAPQARPDGEAMRADDV